MLNFIVFCILIFGIGAFFFAPWVPTKSSDMERIYNALKPSPKDIFYDLGCGDGRLAFFFAKKGIPSYGFEICIFLYLYCRVKKWLTKEKNVDFIFGNFFNKNLENATIVYVFGTDKTLNSDTSLRKKLQSELQPGTKLVSYLFSIDWLKLQEKIKDKNGMSVYVYVI